MPIDTPTILKKIVARKYEEIAERKIHVPLDIIKAHAKDENVTNPVRGFAKALKKKCFCR